MLKGSQITCFRQRWAACAVSVAVAAMAEVIRSIKLGLEDAGAYSILGNCLLQLGDSEKAMRAFQKGLELAPGYADLHNDLGVAHLKLERCREAAASFERALESNRYYQTALLNLASMGLTRTDELAVMVDTVRPLLLTRQALELDDPAYPYSWLE